MDATEIHKWHKYFSSVDRDNIVHNFWITIGSSTCLEGELKRVIFSWLQSATLQLDATQTYTLVLTSPALHIHTSVFIRMGESLCLKPMA